MPRALLALGSNLEDRGEILDASTTAISELSGTQLVARSTWHATRPVGGPPGQGEFLNGAVVIETNLAPTSLRRDLQQIEQRFGRQGTERWAARTLDVDILLYDDRVIDEPVLQVPHPRMSFRPFVLAPAAEIASDMIHPVLGVSIGALWHHLQHAEDMVAICGGLIHDRRRLMEELLCHFPPNSFAEFPALAGQLYPALRIREGVLSPDPFALDRFRSAMSAGLPVASLPKLQIHFSVLAEELAPYVAVRGSLDDCELFRSLQQKPDIPNAMSQLFRGIPTLTLDPRDAPAHLLTEAAAALEAVWPDLCQPAS